ncbi:MAG TPA: hypothetical protein VKW04_11990 [Planctomycetota bacterium]|nr:hypothetical protein [Planctomycetota bacterium]
MSPEKRKPREPSPIPDLLHRIIEYIPYSSEPASPDPKSRARKLGNIAAMKAAAFSGALSMPPGPLGLLTLIPDLLGIWRIQAQLVADIAAVYGKTIYVTKESLLYCLFKHGAAQALRDIAVRSGERLLVRRVTLETSETLLRKIGVRLTQRLATKSITRWLPIIGAIGVGAYAYYDTGEVAKTAIQTFESDLKIDGPKRPP